MEAALIDRLTGSAAVAAVVGENVSWIERGRSGGLPAIVLTEVSGERRYTLGGADGLERTRVQFDLWSADDGELIAMRDAVTAEMESAAEIGGVRFEPAFLALRKMWPRDFDGAGGGDNGALRLTLDWRFYFERILA